MTLPPTPELIIGHVTSGAGIPHSYRTAKSAIAVAVAHGQLHRPQVPDAHPATQKGSQPHPRGGLRKLHRPIKPAGIGQPGARVAGGGGPLCQVARAQQRTVKSIGAIVAESEHNT